MTSFADAVLAWFDVHGRKDLPWQSERTPYRVWVSEIMLQQTQVSTVIPYFHRFMERFPDIAALAAAPVDEVLHHWSGLGYYARARNLHRAAQLIASEHGGEFPADFQQTNALPGVGRSTAGAILAQALGQRHAILDGNVKRVLSRHFGVEGLPNASATNEQLWALAERCTPHERVADYTQAIMDLGATLCVRRRPLCGMCPIAEQCVARRTGRQNELPTPRPRKARPQKKTCMLLLVRENRFILLERRPPAGIWGGLWSLPEFESSTAAQEWYLTQFGASAPQLSSQPPLHHAFTHFDLQIDPIRIDYAADPKRDGLVANPVRADLMARPHVQAIAQSAVMEGGKWLWYDRAAPAKLGLAAPVNQLIHASLSQTEGI